MRKTSHDGGDSSSITSGVENELKKPILSILKPKKTSLKRKPPSTFKEVDETVVEPLLSQDREKPGTSQSAKFFTKTKTDTNNDKISDKSKLLGDDNIQNPISSAIITTANSSLSSNDRYVPKSTITAPIHNHMNTNVFNSHDSNKIGVTTKSQILVEIDSCKPSGYSPSPLIFTTAKIHADGKAKHMEPVQVTPVPILSTVELNLSKNGNVTTNEKKVPTPISVTTLISTVYNPVQVSKIDSKTTTQNSNSVTSVTLNSTGTSKPVVTTQNKTSTTISNIVGSITNNLTTLSNEKVIDKGENITNNQKTNNVPIPIPVVSSLSTTEQTKTITSVKSTNLVIEPIKPTVSAINQVQTNQSNKQNDKSVTDKTKSNSESTQVIDYKMKDSTQANKSNTDTTTVVKPNVSNDSGKPSGRSDNKQLQRQKSIVVEETPKSKTTSGLNASNKIDSSKVSSAKIVSSSAKPNSTIQQKIHNNTSLSKDKTPKPSANEIKTETSKSLQTRTADSSSIKVTSSNKTDKQSNMNSKTINKPITSSTTKNENTISTPNITKNNSIPKTSSNLPKTVSSAITSKPTTVPSTKSTSKVISVTSQKPQSSAVTSVTSTKPMGSGKTQLPASSATSSVTKTSSVSASSTPTSSVITSKPATTKSAPSSSTSETTTSISVLPTSVASANGIAKQDIIKKGSKSSDLSKDGKISKA